MLFAWNYNASDPAVQPFPRNGTKSKVATAASKARTAVFARGVPLGLDFHTLTGRRTDRGREWWGEKRQSASEQYMVRAGDSPSHFIVASLVA